MHIFELNMHVFELHLRLPGCVHKFCVMVNSMSVRSMVRNIVCVDLAEIEAFWGRAVGRNAHASVNKAFLYLPIYFYTYPAFEP